MKEILLTTLAMLSALVFADSAKAAGGNAFGLIYRGAITENAKNKINIHPVTYTLNGLKIAANVYTPAGYDAARKYPAVVVAHPNGGVKEQVAGLYAQRLAENGYVTIAADASYQGASEGTPRNIDKPYYRTEDIHGMADYIGSYPGVDANRLGVLGICGGGGYTLHAAKSDKRFKAVATLSMFNSGQVRRNGYMNTMLDSVQSRLKAASDARAKEISTGEIDYSGNVDFDALTDESISRIPTDLYREGMIYYGQTHRHPNSTFRYTTGSLMELMSWDATDHLELINAPLLMMAGEKADSLYMTEEAFRKAVGTRDKELFKIPGATHIQTYHVPEYVALAVTKLKEFYGRNL
ncbi:alpha/beta hydrolase [Nitratidesulfovibrio sp. SRB-5]|uniref:alpha/beta hydrolase n=1 Tax=Nitratidesulfovibrio sp. SRB-5 TaxID=2872636 RepID=UPI00102564DE|nr:alpha/beta hydrolase [Nitratidesulfovibrio sp. SRB-5]MBZ2171120.1 alpha/beta hydrolase [Nitratidesulfovibrio sp. SRB-5]RXF77952.1 alpha/beta hydrolase [Desulfovibrio sp. DS-1]